MGSLIKLERAQGGCRVASPICKTSQETSSTSSNQGSLIDNSNDSVQAEAWLHFVGRDASDAIKTEGVEAFCDSLDDEALDRLVEYITGLD